jgi:VWFA-related protein
VSSKCVAIIWVLVTGFVHAGTGLARYPIEGAGNHAAILDLADSKTSFMRKVADGPFGCKHSISALIFWSIVMMAVSNPAISQVEVVPATSAVFRDSINVKLINIDVFVTDRHGNPVADLTVGDFEVFENGEPVTISHFALAGTAEPKAPQDDGTANMSTGNFSPKRELPPAVAQDGLLPHLVVAFDSRHLTHVAKRRMLKGLHQYIEETSIPHSKVMVMNLADGRGGGFEVVVPFGSTLEDLEEGLHRIKEMAPGGRGLAIEYQNLIERLTETHMEFRRRDNFRPGEPEPSANPIQACRAVKTQWRAEIQAYSNQTALRVDDTVRRLVDLMQILSGVPGHKAFLYIGGGLELVPGEDVYV